MLVISWDLILGINYNQAIEREESLLNLTVNFLLPVQNFVIVRQNVEIK